MKLGILATVLCALAADAAAEPSKLLVLQSEGRADAATRAKVDAAVLKLAVAAEPEAQPGELNFSDAATAVGCKPETPSCKDEVLGMLAVDEIVITTVTPKPGGLEISVRRIAKSGAAREASMVVATGTPPDRLDGIAPLFGGRAEPRPAPPPVVAHEPRPSPVVTQPEAHHGDHRRLELAGMVGGGALVVLGLAMWGAAAGVQSDIDDAPTRTRDELTHLRDLESKGDTYAALGNVFTIAGLAVGGVATYFYIRDRRSRPTTTARLTPAVLDHGAGLVLTIGGSP